MSETNDAASSQPHPVDDHQRRPLFPVVGIGASAGGLEALNRLFEPMPRHPGMAFVVILHLSPHHESRADSILQRVTTMPVLQVTSDVRIEPDHVYLISPSNQLLMDDGCIRVSELRRPPGTHLAIDLFFRSLAEAHHERAVAIVLSGTGSDGSQGLRRIKETGGVTLVQTPEDAEHDVMPLNAMATGVADFVLPAPAMAQKLVELWENARRIKLPDPPDDLRVGAALRLREREAALKAFQDVMALLFDATGHDFRRYKRATVLRRLERRMQVCRKTTLPAYLRHLQLNPTEARLLLQDMLISVTNFFRDPEAFAALELAIPRLIGGLRAEPTQVRAWVAGCATGEEAYSVAMLLIEKAAATQPQPTVQVFATDVDERAITVARAGRYTESISNDVTPQRLKQFFRLEGDHYRIGKSVRERVTFSLHNVLRDPPFSRLDLVCCRNLLIYLDRDAQRQLLETFHYSLLPHGVLMLGVSETADVADDLFVPIDKKQRLFRPVASGQSRQRQMSSMARELRSLSVERGLVVPPREKLLADIHDQLMAEYAPPTILIDGSQRILHRSPGSGRFLVQRSITSQPLVELVLPSLRVSLQAALQHVHAIGSACEAERVRINTADRPADVHMLVRPMRHPQADPTWMLVIFIEAEAAPAAGPAGEGAVAADPAQTELREARDELLRSITHSETSSEELRAANEELQSLNEELRSATEELETSKEELQSVNEELTTVNYELKSRVDETAKINDDLTNLIAANDIATIFVDAELRIKRFTPRAAAVFNIIASDAGRSLLDITHRLEYDGLAADAREVFVSLSTIEREVRSGDGRWYLVRLLPYRTLEDRIEGAVLNFIDISERRDAEERLRAGEARIRLVAETTQDFAIITLDPAGLLTSWNRGAEQMFGHTEEMVLGQHFSLIYTPADHQRGVPDNEISGAARDGRATDERWHLRRDGTLVYCSGVMTALPGGASGEGFAKIARDLTATKRAQEQREALLQSEQSLRVQLEAANRQKDEFLAVMSHELKNPLNLIALNADLLQRLPETRIVPSVMRIAETIRASVASQAQIINDLLDLSRMQTGKLSLRRHPVEWGEIITRIAEAVQPDAAVKQVTLTLQRCDGPCAVDADPVRLEQIVWNLVSNALKFTPAGGRIELTLGIEDNLARLVVADTGEGIEKAFMERLFEMFSQADSSVARREGGLGIGLALTKRLIDLHGGRLEVESPGRGLGTTFTVVLPRLGAGAVSAPDQVRSRSAVAGLRLLLADDQPDTLETFAMLLQLEGASTVIAGSGEEVLGLIDREEVDLMIFDLAMPGMDGYTLLARLREAGCKVPAIAVSGIGLTGNRKRVLEAGFEEMISKPVDLDALLALIGRLRAG